MRLRVAVCALALSVGQLSTLHHAMAADEESNEQKLRAAIEEAARLKAIAIRAEAARAAGDLSLAAAQKAADTRRQARAAKPSMTGAELAADPSVASADHEAEASKNALGLVDGTRDAADKEVDEQNKKFLGVKFNVGFGAVWVPGRVDEAQLVPGGTGGRGIVQVTKQSAARPVIMLETHILYPYPKRGKHESTKKVLLSGETVDTEQKTAALGPFIGLQSSQDNVIDSIGAGLMFGFKKGKSDSLNIGIGVILDPNAMTLPRNFVDGDEAPEGLPKITAAAPITLVKKAKAGVMFVASFTF